MDGWEPTEVTTHEYDDRDRLIRSVTVREPEWDELSVTEMLALAQYRADLCPNCGGDMHETTATANDERYRLLLPIRCHRCDALARSAERYREAPRPETLLHRVELPGRR